jgi:hypothetical protein
MFVITCPFHFRIHAFPDDYWRMTPSALRRMLAPFGARVVGFQGYSPCPHTVMGLAFKHPAPRDFTARALRFTQAYEAWLHQEEQSLPWKRRVVRRLRGIYRSKGERRQMEDYFRTQFVIDVSVAARLACVG